MRIKNLPDLSNIIEDDNRLDAAIRKELNNDPYCNFQFPPNANPYHVKRFTDVANKVNWWLETHSRPGKAIVTIYVPEPILEVMPEPELPQIIEVIPEPVFEKQVLQEQQPTTKKKKNV